MSKKIKSRNALDAWQEDEAETRRVRLAARHVTVATVTLHLDGLQMTEAQLITKLPGRLKHIHVLFDDAAEAAPLAPIGAPFAVDAWPNQDEKEQTRNG